MKNKIYKIKSDEAEKYWKERIKKVIESQGEINQTELCRELGTSQVTLLKWIKRLKKSKFLKVNYYKNEKKIGLAR